jgi:hypothetical protein
MAVLMSAGLGSSPSSAATATGGEPAGDVAGGVGVFWLGPLHAAARMIHKNAPQMTADLIRATSSYGS